jgi:hypothetical protein
VRQRSKEVLIVCAGRDRQLPAQPEARAHRADREPLRASVRVEGDPTLISPDYRVERFKTASRIVNVPEPLLPVVTAPEPRRKRRRPSRKRRRPSRRRRSASEREPGETSETSEAAGDRQGGKRRRRRRRRGGRQADGDAAAGDRDAEPEAAGGEAPEATEAPVEESAEADAAAAAGEGRRRSRRRPRSRPQEDASPEGAEVRTEVWRRNRRRGGGGSRPATAARARRGGALRRGARSPRGGRRNRHGGRTGGGCSAAPAPPGTGEKARGGRPRQRPRSGNAACPCGGCRTGAGGRERVRAARRGRDARGAAASAAIRAGRGTGFRGAGSPGGRNTER